MLVGQAGLYLNQVGKYLLNVDINNDVLSPDFISINAIEEYEFDREDQFFTKPSTCHIFAFIIAFLILAALVAFVFCVTGGPGGSVEFVVMLSGNPVEGGRIKLSKMRCRSVIRTPGLEDELEIASIVTKKARIDKKRAVDIVAMNTENIPVFAGLLEVDEPFPFSAEINLVYR